MSRSLSADIWESVANSLNSTSIYRLKCCGDKRLIKAIEKRTTASFCGNSTKRLVWPSNVSEDAFIKDLTVKMIHRHNDPGGLADEAAISLQKLPRTLVSLRLKTASITPFTSDNTMGARVRLEQLRTGLPVLESLTCYVRTGWSNQTWVLPPSLTYARLRGGYYCKTINRELPLPPNLKHLISDCSFETEDLPPLPATLETLMVKQIREDISHLTLLRTVAGVSPSNGLNKLPLLSRISATISFDEENCYPSLTDLHSEYTSSYKNVASLPRNLTRWTVNDHQLEPVAPDLIKDLPPALRYLRIADEMNLNGLTAQVVSSLPRNLALIDIRWTRIDLKMALPLFPKNLTGLRTHNLTKHNASLLSRFTDLRELRLYGGQITASMARKIPRTLETLSLFQVALVTKGRYFIKGSTEKLTYSASNPDITALDGTLPPRLKSLTVTPSSLQTYWASFAYDIFKSIPTTLTSLVLDNSALYRTRIAIHPRSSPLFVPPNSSAEEVVLPSDHSSVDRSTDLFSRLPDLFLLYVYGSKHEADKEWFSRHLPRKLKVWYGPRLSVEEAQSLPTTLVYMSAHSYPYIEDEVIKAIGRTPTSYHWYDHRYKYSSDREDTFFSHAPTTE